MVGPAHLGVAGPVGEDDAVEVEVEEVVVVGAPARTSQPRCKQAAQDVGLAAAVDQHHGGAGARGRWLAARRSITPCRLTVATMSIALGSKRAAVSPSPTSRAPSMVPRGPQPLGQRPGCRRRRGRDALLGRASRRGCGSARAVGVAAAVLPHHQAGDLDPLRLEAGGQAVRVQARGGDAVVAHQGVGEDQDLAGVGGVGEGLRVADHAGVEHHLAGGRDRARRTAAPPAPFRPRAPGVRQGASLTTPSRRQSRPVSSDVHDARRSKPSLRATIRPPARPS